MLGMFKEAMRFLKFDAVWIDNQIFRLHYKITVGLFFIASLLVTSRQYVGDPIDCMVDEIPGDMMDTYCWIHSTFSIPSRWKGTRGVDHVYPGVSPQADLQPGEERVYHKYYMWVALVLACQTAMFMIPRYIWKSAEGGKIRMLIQGLMEPIIDDDTKSDQIRLIVKYFRLNRGGHVVYALTYFACEVLNFVHVIGQIYIIDSFVGGEFTTYGLDVLNYTEMDHEDRPDPMHVVFPKMAKCTFHKYGPSGTIEKKDGLCVLPVNIINEKIFIFLWFWLVIVSAITGVFLIYRVAVLAGPQIRIALITVKGGKSTKRSDVEAILEPDSLSWLEKVGDWLVLYFLCKNLDVLTVNDLIRQIHKSEAVGSNNANDTETLKLKDSGKSSAV